MDESPEGAGGCLYQYEISYEHPDVGRDSATIPVGEPSEGGLKRYEH